MELYPIPSHFAPDVTDPDLVRRGKLIGELIAHPGWEALKELINEWKDNELLLVLQEKHPLDNTSALGGIRGALTVSAIAHGAADDGREAEARLHEKENS